MKVGSQHYLPGALLPFTATLQQFAKVKVNEVLPSAFKDHTMFKRLTVPGRGGDTALHMPYRYVPPH